MSSRTNLEKIGVLTRKLIRTLIQVQALNQNQERPNDGRAETSIYGLNYKQKQTINAHQLQTSCREFISFCLKILFHFCGVGNLNKFHNIFQTVACAMHSNLGHGHQTHASDQKLLKIATLNYSGVLTSPYEFYEKEDEHEKKITKVFSDLVSKKYPEFCSQDPKAFAWDMGSIDTKWKSRYSPSNIYAAGVIEKEHKMMNQKQFLAKWDQVQKETLEKETKAYFEGKYSNIEERAKAMSRQVERTREFDLFTYRTFIEVVYGVADISNLNVSSEKYLAFRKPHFQKPFLDKKLKIKSTLQNLHKLNPDLFYVQEADQLLKDQLKKFPGYLFIQRPKMDSAIMIKKGAFGIDEKFDAAAENSKFVADYCKAVKQTQGSFLSKVLLNNDSVFQAGKGFFLLNVHLSSKKDKNEEQVKVLKEIILNLFKHFADLRIVIGGDFNENIQALLKQLKLQDNMVYPSDQSTPTVKKKRTMMQPQRHKGDKMDAATKDFFVTNRSFKEGACIFANGETVSKESPLLPNSVHPYDHYMLIVKMPI